MEPVLRKNFTLPAEANGLTVSIAGLPSGTSSESDPAREWVLKAEDTFSFTIGGRRHVCCNKSGRPLFIRMNGLAVHEFLAKAGRPKAIDPERKSVLILREKLKGDLAERLAPLASKAAEQLAHSLESRLTKAADSEAERRTARRMVAGLSIDWSDVVDDVEPALSSMALDGGALALAQVGVSNEAAEDQLRGKATKWASDRAAEMVGMKRDDDGNLVPNPDAKWRIDDATRNMLRTQVEQALREGWSADALASAVKDGYAFSSDRAEAIARTELARADVAGAVAGWEASGLVKSKQWLTAPDCCPECQEVDGEVVGLHDQFSLGGPPGHPQCRCSVVPVLNEEG